MIIATHGNAIMLLLQRSSSDKERGFSLIEILVSLLVLAIGLLGLASLQSVAVKNNHDAYLSSQAQLLAQEMADRIRSNEQYAACPGDPDRQRYTNNYNNVPAHEHDCINEACSPAQIAENDMAEWQKKIKDILPSVSEEPGGMVCIDDDPSDDEDCTACTPSAARICPYLIRLTWLSNYSGDAAPTTFRMAATASRIVFCEE